MTPRSGVNITSGKEAPTESLARIPGGLNPQLKDPFVHHDWYPRRESNPDLKFRKLLFYPLNYGGVGGT